MGRRPSGRETRDTRRPRARSRRRRARPARTRRRAAAARVPSQSRARASRGAPRGGDSTRARTRTTTPTGMKHPGSRPRWKTPRPPPPPPPPPPRGAERLQRGVGRQRDDRAEHRARALAPRDRERAARERQGGDDERAASPSATTSCSRGDKRTGRASASRARAPRGTPPTRGLFARRSRTVSSSRRRRRRRRRRPPIARTARSCARRPARRARDPRPSSGGRTASTERAPRSPPRPKGLVRAEAIARRRRRPRRTVGRTPERFLTLERTLDRFPPASNGHPYRPAERPRPPPRRKSPPPPPPSTASSPRRRRSGGGSAHLRGDGARRGGVRPPPPRRPLFSPRPFSRLLLRRLLRGVLPASRHPAHATSHARRSILPRFPNGAGRPRTAETVGAKLICGKTRVASYVGGPRGKGAPSNSARRGAPPAASPSSPSSRRAPSSSPPRGGPRVVREQERVGLLGRPPPWSPASVIPWSPKTNNIASSYASLRSIDARRRVERPRAFSASFRRIASGPDAVRVPRVVHAEEVSDQDVPPLGLGERRVQVPPHALVDEVEVLDVEARERLAPRAEGGARVREQVQPRVVAGEGDAKAHPSGGDGTTLSSRSAAPPPKLSPTSAKVGRPPVRSPLSLCCVVVGGSATNRNRSPNEGPSRARRSPKTLMGGGGGGDARWTARPPRPGFPTPRREGFPTARGAREVESRAVDDEDDRLVHGRARPAPGEPGGGGTRRPRRRPPREESRRTRSRPLSSTREQEPGGERAQPRRDFAAASPASVRDRPGRARRERDRATTTADARTTSRAGAEDESVTRAHSRGSLLPRRALRVGEARDADDDGGTRAERRDDDEGTWCGEAKNRSSNQPPASSQLRTRSGGAFARSGGVVLTMDLGDDGGLAAPGELLELVVSSAPMRAPRASCASAPCFSGSASYCVDVHAHRRAARLGSREAEDEPRAVREDERDALAWRPSRRWGRRTRSRPRSRARRPRTRRPFAFSATARRWFTMSSHGPDSHPFVVVSAEEVAPVLGPVLLRDLLDGDELFALGDVLVGTRGRRATRGPPTGRPSRGCGPTPCRRIPPRTRSGGRRP